MSTSTKRIPEGCQGVIPHLVVGDSNRAMEFYNRVFGADELARMHGPDGQMQERANAAYAAMGKPTA